MKPQTAKARLSLGALVAGFLVTSALPVIATTAANADTSKKIVVVVGPVTKTPKPAPTPGK